ncbi:unnamed protein product [Fusarium graminearum]|uniref:Uncharacterized protein n=1 Tax=Gibberella zeae TaxID=5518 RepID=A0A9N8NAP0_GIBZA|nr:unnamed protein product [Fusarium graminearum]
MDNENKKDEIIPAHPIANKQTPPTSQQPKAVGAIEHREWEGISYNTSTTTFTAEDDGGLRYCSLKENISLDFFALVEAKKKVMKFVNNQPFIADNVLAQMTCEAIVTKMKHRKEVCSGSVVVIHIAERCDILFIILASCYYVAKDDQDEHQLHRLGLGPLCSPHHVQNSLIPAHAY